MRWNVANGKMRIHFSLGAHHPLGCSSSTSPLNICAFQPRTSNSRNLPTHSAPTQASGKMSPAEGKKKGARSIFSPQAMQAFGTDNPFHSSNVTPPSNFGATMTPTAKAFSPAQAAHATPKFGSNDLFGSSSTMPQSNLGTSSAPSSSAWTTSPFAKTETVPDPRLPACRDVE